MADRILVDTPATFEVTFYTDGAPANDSPVTVTVTRADGTAIVTNAATTSPGIGRYQWSITAAQAAELDHLTLTWVGASGQRHVTKAEIVGGFYLSETEARSLDSRFALGATPLISSADIRRVRAETEDAIEAEAGVAFVQRFAQVTLDGSGKATLMVPHLHPRRVRSVRTYTTATTFTSYSAADLEDFAYARWGQIRRWSGAFAPGQQNIVVAYEHGFDSPPPLIRQAARMLFAVKMLEELVTIDPSLANVRSLSVEGYSVTYGERSLMEQRALGRVEQWKGSTTPAGVAIA